MTTRIAFKDVSVSFDQLKVVESVSFDVADREFVSIIGPSGCGKTTMMNIVAGFVKPTTGTVLLDAKPIEGPGPERGVIFQEYGVFPWLTVKENIGFGLTLNANRVDAKEREDICQRYMQLMGLSDFANAYPKTLSGGMRQRLAIARAYAVKPQFLLMDEPFGALDAQSRSAMQDLLLTALSAERKTVMLITHSVDEAIYLSTKIIVVTARPSRIKEIITVPFEYPRNESIHSTQVFSDLRAHIHALVMQEYAVQQMQFVSGQAARS